MWFLRLRAAALALLCLTGVTGAVKNACDDGMGGDDGSGLRKVKAVTPGTAQLPESYRWAHPYVKQVLRNQGRLDEIMTWPKGSPPKTDCALMGFTYNKLCVPKRNDTRDFRTKVALRTACGPMVVKWRIRVDGTKARATMWGRSKT